MSDWEEADVGGQERVAAIPTKEPEMTTDDLVLMVGEAVIKERHGGKIATFLRQGIVLLQQSLAKEKSLQTSLQERVDILEADNKNKANMILELEAGEGQFAQATKERDIAIKEAAGLVALLTAGTNKLAETQVAAEKAKESQRIRILQLEDQVHQVALERDRARKNEQVTLDKVEALEASLKEIQLPIKSKKREK